MIQYVDTITCGSFFILAFIAFVNPLRVNIEANKWLALFLSSLGFMMFDCPFFKTSANAPYHYLLSTTDAAVFVIAPSLFLTIEYFVVPAKRFQKQNLWHFLPALLVISFQMTFISLDTDRKKIIFEWLKTGNPMAMIVIFLVIPIIIYWIFSYKKLIKHTKNTQLFASSTDVIDLAWLRNFLLAGAFMTIVWLNEVVLFVPSIAKYSSLLYLLAAYYFAYYILQQKEIFSVKQEENLEIKSLIEETNEPEIIKKQLLSEEQLAFHKIKLSELMTTQKPYLESTLSLPKLAEMVDLTPHELSYLINQGFNDNFFGFVNRFRVEESQRILTSIEYKHFSILAIAYESGFNSKTAFYTTFKKIIGISPSEFQRELR